MSPTRYSSDGRGTGSGLSSTRSTSVNTAVLPPIPSASVSTHTTVNPGVCRSRRTAAVRSDPKPRHPFIDVLLIFVTAISTRRRSSGATDLSTCRRLQRRASSGPAACASVAASSARSSSSASRSSRVAARRSIQRATRGTSSGIRAYDRCGRQPRSIRASIPVAWANARSPAGVSVKCLRVRPPCTGSGSESSVADESLLLESGQGGVDGANRDVAAGPAGDFLADRRRRTPPAPGGPAPASRRFRTRRGSPLWPY